MSTNDYPYLITRYKALLIDGVVLFGGFAVTMLLVQADDLRPYAFGAYLIISFLYEPVMLATLSATIGHKMCNIKVVQFNAPDRKLTLMSGILRNVMKLALGWVSFLTINFNPEHRAVHDYASSSLVVNDRKHRTAQGDTQTRP